MNMLDLIIMVIVLLALRRGLRIGLLSLVLSAGGFVLGLYLGSLLAGALGHGIGDSEGRILTALALSLVIGFLLAATGEAIAVYARQYLQRWKLSEINKYLGAAFETVFILFVIWLLASVFSNVTTSDIGRQVRSSAIITTLNRVLPPPPDLLSQLEQALDTNSLPKVFIGNEPSRRPVPNTTPLSDEIIQSTQKSIVMIEGRGCGGIVEGSGFVAGTDLIVTNAHVVAGIAHPHVTANGHDYDATPVYFDQRLDLALLRVSGLDLPVLPITAEVLPNGTAVALMGYPGGGPLTINSGAIIDNLTAIGRDIYDRGMVSREIYEVTDSIESGDSGGPMIDGQGRVAGLIFAKSVSNDGVGYTLLTSQIISPIKQYGASHTTVSTGRCAAG